ncbi:hypothetical protein QBZ16_002876 [Prototheca wickerhamii]|uniref:AP2/ERF domain-containing protein n=1 Tax=Prototheca wickerhamii TaxID=3111 RepID=A0AAD9ML57_PROWI|nr:hypothetical protein QBZ16_002876 [Prototheca wickerhamii]
MLADIHKLASDDFCRMLQFDGLEDGEDVALSDLDNVFQDHEGAELLDGGLFGDLMSPRGVVVEGAPGHAARPSASKTQLRAPAQQQAESHDAEIPALVQPPQEAQWRRAPEVGTPSAAAAAARSVLASLGEPAGYPVFYGGVQPGPTDGPRSPYTHAEAPRPVQTRVAAHADPGTPQVPRLPSSTASEPPPRRRASGCWSRPPRRGTRRPFSYAPVAPPGTYDLSAGSSPVQHLAPWGLTATPGRFVHAPPGAYFPNVAYMGPHDPAAGQPVLHFGGGYHAVTPAAPMHHIVHGMTLGAGTPSPRKSPKRRRPSKGVPATPMETPRERSARLAQGFTYDPATGRMLPHGPALLAAARHDKPVPVVGALYEAHAATPFDGNPAPPEYTIGAQHAARSLQDASGPREEPGGGATPAGLAPAGPGPTPPSGRALRGQSGTHGLLTALVTQDLLSTPPEPAAVGPAAAPDGAAPSPAGAPPGPALRGVTRERWSLFWDAYIERPETSAMLDGFKQEAVWLGRYPTAESAARAHDIAALKLHGPDSAQTNFGTDLYARVLPALGEHSEDQVVSALRKDSALAIQRTSRYRGVRRVGQRAFDARLETAKDSATSSGGTSASHGAGATQSVSVGHRQAL